MMRAAIVFLVVFSIPVLILHAQHSTKVIAIDGQRRLEMIRTGEKAVMSYFNIDRGDTSAKVLVTVGADTVRFRFLQSSGDTLSLRLKYALKPYTSYLHAYETFAGDDGDDSLEARLPGFKGSVEPQLLIEKPDSAHFVMGNGEIRSETLLAITRDTIYLAGSSFDPEKPNGATVIMLSVKDVVAVSAGSFNVSDTVARIQVHGSWPRLIHVLHALCSVEPVYPTCTLPEITRADLVVLSDNDTVKTDVSLPWQNRPVLRVVPNVMYGTGAEAPLMSVTDVGRNKVVRQETVHQSDSTVIGGGISGRYAIPIQESFDVVGGMNVGVLKTTVSSTPWNTRESSSTLVDVLGGVALVLGRFDEAGYKRLSCSIGLSAGVEVYHLSYTARAYPNLNNAIGNDATIHSTASTLGLRPMISLEVLPTIRLSRQWSITLLATLRYTLISTQSMQVQYQGATGVFQMNVDYPTGVALLATAGIGVSYAL